MEKHYNEYKIVCSVVHLRGCDCFKVGESARLAVKNRKKLRMMSGWISRV